MERQVSGDAQVIVMTHEPVWLLQWYWAQPMGPNLRQLIRGHLRGRARVHLAGDLHFYMRHSLQTCEDRRPAGTQGQPAAAAAEAAKQHGAAEEVASSTATHQPEAAASAAPAAAAAATADSSVVGSDSLRKRKALLGASPPSSMLGSCPDFHSVQGGSQCASTSSSSSSSGLDSSSSSDVDCEPRANGRDTWPKDGTSGCGAMPPADSRTSPIKLWLNADGTAAAAPAQPLGSGRSEILGVAASGEAAKLAAPADVIEQASAASSPDASPFYPASEMSWDARQAADVVLERTVVKPPNLRIDTSRLVRGGSVDSDSTVPCAVCGARDAAASRHHHLDPDHMIVNGMGGAFMHPTHVFSGR